MDRSVRPRRPERDRQAATRTSTSAAGPVAALAAVWKRLGTFLEVHALAEEELFYPELLRVGTGGGDADSAAGSDALTMVEELPLQQDGVPLQVVVIIALGVFITTYLFF